jgi:RNase P/RNase MRP subunit POP5
MLQLKPLKPALREKKRYLVYEIQTNDELDMFKAQHEIIKEIHKLLGIFDAAKAGIMPIKFDKETKRGIFKLNHTAVEQVRACFILISKIQNNQIQIVTKGISGILHIACEKYFVNNITKGE